MEKETLPYDLILVGAGIVGSLTAWFARKSGLRILVLESAIDISMGSSKANSGIIHGGYAEKTGFRAALCYPGRLAYPELDTFLHFGYRKTGSFVLAFTPDEEEGLHTLLAQGRKNGVEDLQIWSRNQILQREPRVNPQVRAGLFCEGAGVASPYELVIAAMEQAVQEGIVLQLGSKVVGIERDARYLRVQVEESGQKKEYKTHFLVNAAGAGSGQISELVGDTDVNLSFRKGEYLLFRKGSGNLGPVLFQMPTALGKGILVTSTYHGNLMIGPDAQNDTDPEDTSTSIPSLTTIFSEARKTIPDLDAATLIRSFSGVRTLDKSGDFVIAPSSVEPRVIHAGGIQSPGLTAGPEIAKIILGLLKDQGLSVQISGGEQNRKPIIRKKDLPLPELRDRIDLPLGDPRRIVCRCEQVSEAEIRDALGRGLPVLTTDGVKRRTRAGMGWCQGQFCRPRVAEILREVNKGADILDTEDVVHSGVSRVRREQFKAAMKDLEQ
ncbi:MAG: NAD(P)/FAD-dependent oxidoreductase [Spirochaetales bacterium]|nr:NAD(P)/FAD-dependent oxidoreductase [Spirochaetales bacterium]